MCEDMMKIFKCCIVLLILVIVASCIVKHEKIPVYLAGKTYVDQNTLGQIKFLNSNIVIFEWPDKDHHYGCQGMCSMEARYRSLSKNGEIDYMLTSSQTFICPYRKLTLTPSREKIIVIDKEDETRIFVLLVDK